MACTAYTFRRKNELPRLYLFRVEKPERLHGDSGRQSAARSPFDGLAGRWNGYLLLPTQIQRGYRQLRENPKVEIAFHQPAAPQALRTLPELGTVPGIGTLLRITGRFEFLEDVDTRKWLFDVNPWLKQLGEGTDCSCG